MNNQFNLRKFLTENKLTEASKKSSKTKEELRKAWSKWNSEHPKDQIDWEGWLDEHGYQDIDESEVLKEDTLGFQQYMDAVEDVVDRSHPRYDELADALLDALDNGDIYPNFNEPSSFTRDVEQIANKLGIVDGEEESPEAQAGRVQHMKDRGDFGEFAEGAEIKREKKLREDVLRILASSNKEKVQENYYGSSEIEDVLYAIGYENLENFLEDNQGAREVLLEWIVSIPEFKKRLMDKYNKSDLESLGIYIDG